ncbi:c-type cytochrome [Parapedobacter soli]|uniref:c-type cytochrome n=1 Tax=Parapedobacter soli TaxID=416955 RepID=UPI0021C5EFA2|nr:c-type cytochrome [Parapedobacter soli]
MTTKIKQTRYLKLIAAMVVALVWASGLAAQESPKEEDYFRIRKVRTPEGIILEVGGLAMLPNGNLGVSTRRGDVYIIENPTSSNPYFRKFASGLHEILGLAYKDGALYCAQRGELTKLVDTDNDGKADVYETIYAWPLSGHYHEYSFGPIIAPDGSFFVTGNVAFGDEEWWRGESRVPWRGWAVNITEDGKLTPWATGMRSPAGPGLLNGQFFYTENQGDWIGSGGLWQVNKGDFMGHPAGLRWAGLPGSPVKLTTEQFVSKMDERRVKNDQGRFIKPENIINEQYKTAFDAKQEFGEFRLPAVWLPHGILGISSSQPTVIPDGVFGPFAGQVLVGDQGMSMLSRVMLEEVNGQLQGAAIGFRSGFRSGVLRIEWAPDGSLFVGETNRGWGSAGDANEGLERLEWNGEIPFEMQTVKAMPDGFEITFTLPVDTASANDLASYHVESYTYKYHPVYGSPPVDVQSHPVKGVKVSADGLRARIIVDGLKEHYIHTITLDGIREKDRFYSLIHPTAYYTLHSVPQGAKLAMDEVSTKDSSIPLPEPEPEPVVVPKQSGTAAAAVKAPAVKKAVAKAPTFKEVEGLLTKYTCIACHNPDKRQVGPSYADIAKRKYSDEKIVELIYNPQPQNWPGYATPMAPMPHVPKADALKIAAYINSLAN